MGTRHLIEVKIDGELKVAQYGQWDGYLDGQGKDIAKFIHEEMKESEFREALKQCRFLDESDKAFTDSIDNKPGWQKTHPWLSRDAGAKVLSMIQYSFGAEEMGTRVFPNPPSGLALGDSRDFRINGYGCEYWYLIDMDARTVAINGGTAIPFRMFTVELMKSLDKTAQSGEPVIVDVVPSELQTVTFFA